MRFAFVSSPDRRWGRMLLQTPGVRLFEFPQADGMRGVSNF